MAILTEKNKNELIRLMEKELRSSISDGSKEWLVFYAEVFLESRQAENVLKHRRELAGLQARIESFLISIGKKPPKKPKKRGTHLPSLVIGEALHNTLNFSYKPGRGLAKRDYLFDRCEQMIQELLYRVEMMRKGTQTKGGQTRKIGSLLDWASNLIEFYVTVKHEKPTIKILEDLLSKSLRCIGPIGLGESSRNYISRTALSSFHPVR